jgi:predicted transcriptional regulator
MVRWELISFVKRSSQRKKILEVLNGPSTPTQISKRTNMYLTHVSRTLRELAKKGLIESLTPNERVEKYYKITKLGKDILNQVNRIEKN